MAHKANVEGVLGELKARDIIPNWPRGRSTSKPYQLDLSGLHIFGWPCVLSQTAEETVFGVDHRFMQDWADEQAEERRKADMMEVWYWIARNAARGPFHPEPINHKMFESYLVPLIRLEQEAYGY